MNPLTLIVMAGIAFYFWSAGATFLAFLVFIVALIMALGSTQQKAPAAMQGAVMAPGGQMPIVVQAGGGGSALPRKFEFRPNFPGDPDGDEWISGKLGAWIVLIVRIIQSLFSLGQPRRREHDEHD
ncbi:hypothetical protein KJ765_05030 [Candidatus Micrarchaeota archaeon]|nr:hypothetical protein [Candidatus Micrarchaeota archaeon]